MVNDNWRERERETHPAGEIMIKISSLFLPPSPLLISFVLSYQTGQITEKKINLGPLLLLLWLYPIFIAVSALESRQTEYVSEHVVFLHIVFQHGYCVVLCGCFCCVFLRSALCCRVFNSVKPPSSSSSSSSSSPFSEIE